ncbi:MAG: MmgE/PrpD family protein [Proteobacteria bacterium]|nr:MmgE/PrpD family protein [Pseudomonadota bacterium]
MGFTRTLAEWTAALRYEDLPPAALPWVKAATLDYLAVSLAGCGAPGVALLKRYALSQYAPGPATVIGHAERMSAEGAALLNGAISHWEEYDDATFGMWGHPSVAIMPALFAAAEAEGADGRTFAAAYVAGVEACAKIGRLVTPQQVRLGWHPTATVGTLGAAGAVGRLLGLDAATLETALGLAATQSSGLRCQFGTMAKPLHAGLAARGGLSAAMLARAGFVGAPAVIEHAHGYAHALSGAKPADIAAFESRIGRPLEILDPGLAFKRFPSNFQTQAPATAALRIRHRRGIGPDEIDEVVCLVNHMMQLSLIHERPKTGLEGKLSLNYAVAAALVDGQLEVEQYSDERVWDPRIRDMLGRVRFEPHPGMAGIDFTQGAKFLHMEMVVRLKDGREVREKVTEGFSVPGVEGDKPHPELIAKFTRNARRVLTEARIGAVLDRVQGLETLPRAAALLEPVRAG